MTFTGLHADRLPTLASFLGAEPTAVIYGRNCGKLRQTRNAAGGRQWGTTPKQGRTDSPSQLRGGLQAGG